MDKYILISQLGKGNFGSISKIKRKSDNKILIWKELSYSHLSQKEKQQIEEKLNQGGMSHEELTETTSRYRELSEQIEEKEFRWLELSD